MHRLTVHYAAPDDVEEFDRRYVEEHVPMVAPMEAVRSFTWSWLRPLGGEGGVHMVAELDFDDAASMKATLASPEMAAAGAHAQTLGATVTMYTGEVHSTS
jgi:uncharacterized protein (TIGR02118 family)